MHSNMNLQETIIQLNELKLRGMSSSFEAMTSLPVQNRPSLEVAISKMVDAEVQDRRVRKTAMYLKISKLRYTALLEDVICGTDRNFTKDDLAAIADCAFIRRHENLLIQGLCGMGPPGATYITNTASSISSPHPACSAQSFP